MGTVLCLNATALTEYAALALSDGRSALDRVQAYAKRLSGLDRVVVLAGTEQRHRNWMPQGWELVTREQWSEQVLLDALEELDADRIIYAFADSPFLDVGVTERMRETHTRYFAEYTFAEGYPGGVTPEVLEHSAVPRLRRVLGDEDPPIARDSLFRILQKDINAFDVETELAPDDYRLLRLSLYCGLKRDFLICKTLSEHGPEDVGELLELVDERRELLRSIPAFVSIQVVRGISQDPVHSPYTQVVPDAAERDEEMSLERFSALLDRLEEFAPDAMLHVSLWGEIGLHSEAYRLLWDLAERSSLQPVVETSGVGWDPDVAESAMQLPHLTWIVALDAAAPELYERIRGPGYEEARDFAERLLQHAPERTYVQAVRMQENEEHLQDFYRSWSERTENIIVLKYDHFSGRLPDRRVTDISPLKRLPCWHLKRDLYVLLDGTVPMCREDLEGAYSLGNAFDDELEAVWERGQTYHVQHVQQVYPELCAKCDEYYTFNN
jgi:spiro-SPASM protein